MLLFQTLNTSYSLSLKGVIYLKKIVSKHKTAIDIVGDFKKVVINKNPKLFMIFSSSLIDFSLLNEELHKTFPNAEIIGCTTSGELTSEGFSDETVVAMAFFEEDSHDMKIELIKNTREELGKKVKNSLDQFSSYFKQPVNQMDHNKYLGFVLMDGMSQSEEKVMEELSNSTNVFFVGGSAGDDLKFKETHLFINGEVLTHSVILVLMRPKKEFQIVKTQSFKSLGKKLIATKVDEKTRRVIEFNGLPATVAYAKELNVPVEELEQYFMTNPVGLIAENEIFVRSPQQIKETDIFFYCQILEGMEVEILVSTNIIDDTKKLLDEKAKEKKDVSGIIDFCCILRKLELVNKGLDKKYGEVYPIDNAIGFATYGEAFLGHINQTSTMVLFH